VQIADIEVLLPSRFSMQTDQMWKIFFEVVDRADLLLNGPHS